jgi:hypothetical protein
MKEFGNIYLIWRSGSGKSRHVVGVIKHNYNDGIRFHYIKENLDSAIKEGFHPYTEFPELDREYSNNVLEIFGQRVMKFDRDDISKLLDFWQIDYSKKENKLYLLAKTQGLIPNDNFEFLADYNPTKNARFTTDLAGLTALKLPANTVLQNETLEFRCEPSNQYDANAVAIFKGDIKIGYIKRIHSRFFYKIKPNQSVNLSVKSVEQNGTIRRIFVNVILR